MKIALKYIRKMFSNIFRLFPNEMIRINVAKNCVNLHSNGGYVDLQLGVGKLSPQLCVKKKTWCPVITVYISQPLLYMEDTEVGNSVV